MFVRDVLSAKIDSPNLLMKVKIAAGHYRSRSRLSHFVYIDTYRTNYGTNAPFNAALSHFNDVSHVFEFYVSRQGFRALLMSTV
jgi:hypothetical protein